MRQVFGLDFDLPGFYRFAKSEPALAELCFTALERADLAGLPAAQRHDARLELFKREGKLLEAQRLSARTRRPLRPTRGSSTSAA